jgi:GT2 family glycosyltransferase
MLAPIVLFVYNRPWHTEETLKALMLNELADESVLYIYCDGPKKNTSPEDISKIKEVRQVIRKKKWCKEVAIIESDINLGLANSILKGVTDVVNKYGKIIVLEDDIVVTQDFLYYMNKSLHIFENKKNVYHINGFNNESNLQYLLDDYYFLNFMSCWGWATWIDRWSQLNLDFNYFYDKLLIDEKAMSRFNYGKTLSFDNQLEANIKGEIKTWAILWYATVNFNKGLCLTPKYSLVNNIGMDGSGVHCSENVFYNNVYEKTNAPLKDSLIQKIKYRELLRHRVHLKLFFKYGSKLQISFIIKEIIANLKRILKRIKKMI